MGKQQRLRRSYPSAKKDWPVLRCLGNSNSKIPCPNPEQERLPKDSYRREIQFIIPYPWVLLYLGQP
jgi:hypothetical protein